MVMYCEKRWTEFFYSPVPPKPRENVMKSFARDHWNQWLHPWVLNRTTFLGYLEYESSPTCYEKSSSLHLPFGFDLTFQCHALTQSSQTVCIHDTCITYLQARTYPEMSTCSPHPTDTTMTTSLMFRLEDPRRNLVLIGKLVRGIPNKYRYMIYAMNVDIY